RKKTTKRNKGRTTKAKTRQKEKAIRREHYLFERSLPHTSTLPCDVNFEKEHITASLSTKQLLDRTSRLRKDSVGVGPNQSYRADNKDKDYSQHHGVFSDVLSIIVRPELGEEGSHNHLLWVGASGGNGWLPRRDVSIVLPTAWLVKRTAGHHPCSITASENGSAVVRDLHSRAICCLCGNTYSFDEQYSGKG